MTPQIIGASDGETRTEDRKDPSEPEKNRGQLFWDAAKQNVEADSREGAGVNFGPLTLFLLAKPAELSCLFLQCSLSNH
jgi:hypothetical protein